MITLDTDVYVSAFHFGGKPMSLLEFALAGEFQIAISLPILKETIRVLREKFGWQEDDLLQVVAVLDTLAVRFSPIELLHVVNDEPDNRILECAIASGSSQIVSGDKDLLRLSRYETIEILRVAEFLERTI